MRTTGLIAIVSLMLFGIVLVLDADLASHRPVPPPSAAVDEPIRGIHEPTPQPPEFGWQPISEAAFPLAANEHRELSLPRHAKLRIEVNASAVVSLSSPCDMQRILKGSVECTVPTDAPNVLISDERANPKTNGQLLESATALLTRKGAQEAFGPNRVDVTWYAWECIANCPSK